MESKKGQGVVLVATGPVYVEAAIRSARSVKEHCGPDLPVHIWTDLPEVCAAAAGAFDSVERIENPHRRSKVDHLWRTPFERTLFLDADTRVVADVRGLFSLLDRFDLCMAHAHRRSHAKSATTSSSSSSSSPASASPPPVEFPQLNSGVFLYRRSEGVVAFLKRWQEVFHAAALPKDQVTLRELLWTTDLRVYVLPPEYNVRYQKYIDAWDAGEAQPKILHMRKFVDEIKQQTAADPASSTSSS
ncbi:uncharacterized protein ACA1_073480 [Acanthamoeba castellanii str. Neff]|uniref:Nucleotide-diphospho-sugar transferase domain-containing protein n=1 Tax=Acanthamoeba castellanii (strain ATCC 30010 / Neff) TaxID=1257118 RepID=L8HDV6_ACACF|nr:uncharacterized protein ACA1_073480 [Acanthamoeba castellanii str. Neff]ELR23704.1 hypothetical protein ACA1_073480 [Acanthamoeba castellanii str. Neff]